MENRKHHGKVVRNIIKNSGYTFLHVAKCLNISRNTLYMRFQQEQLPGFFLYKIGQIINYNFAINFPELENDSDYLQAAENAESPEVKYHKQIATLQKKYYETLEDYNKLLRFLVKIVNDNEFYSLKKEIELFVDNSVKREKEAETYEKENGLTT